MHRYPPKGRERSANPPSNALQSMLPGGVQLAEAARLIAEILNSGPEQDISLVLARE